MSPELAHAIQGNHHRLLQKLEAMAWAQALRPYHLYGLRVAANSNLFLWDGVPYFPGSRDLSPESLGRRALWASDPYAPYRTLTQTGDQRAHGWNPYDPEHWSTDLLFDYWTITGDAWAWEELRQLEQSLKALMKLENAYTAHIQTVRAEGWTMQGFVQCYQATGDPATKDYAIRRAREIVDVERMKDHPSKTLMTQGSYAGTGWPMPHEFYMPWQHGAVLYGYLAAARFLEDPVFMAICEDVVQAVAYGWVTDFTDPHFGTFPNGLRYYVPTSFEGIPCRPDVFDATHSGRFGDSPLGGAHGFLVGGLHHLADLTRDPTVRDRALLYGSWLRGHIEDRDRWYKWNFCLPIWHVR
jgi:hypothetical protein